jgi:hypothetical protein
VEAFFLPSLTVKESSQFDNDFKRFSIVAQSKIR